MKPRNCRSNPKEKWVEKLRNHLSIQFDKYLIALHKIYQMNPAWFNPVATTFILIGASFLLPSKHMQLAHEISTMELSTVITNDEAWLDINQDYRSQNDSTLAMWAVHSQLAPLTPIEDTCFGQSIAIDGDTAVIGALCESLDLGDGLVYSVGSAYVFVRDGLSWSQQAKLIASDAQYLARFGNAVAIQGNTILVGAKHDDPDLGAGPIEDAGSAYVFVRNGTSWTQVAKLIADNADEYDVFGSSVAISGDTIVVSAPYSDPDPGGGPIPYAGSVYVFQQDGTNWIQQAQLYASDAQHSGEFGYSMDFNDSTIVVGAPYHDVGGSVYIFVWDGLNWGQEAKLISEDPESAGKYGKSVAIDGDRLIISKYGVDVQGDYETYIYTRSGSSWTIEAKFEDYSGRVDISGDRVVIKRHIFKLEDQGWVKESEMNIPWWFITYGPEVQEPVALDGSVAVARVKWFDIDTGDRKFGVVYFVYTPYTFFDVKPDRYYWRYVEALYNVGMTVGYPDIGYGIRYHPMLETRRSHTAVFLKKGIHGVGYSPPIPDGSHPFPDITGHWAEAWIEDLYDEGMTAGYPDGTYRPDSSVTRAQIAMLLLRAMHWPDLYTPPPASGTIFEDVPVDHWAAAWIEQLVAEGITGGCRTDPPMYCPERYVSRGDIAILLVRTFNLPLPIP